MGTDTPVRYDGPLLKMPGVLQRLVSAGGPERHMLSSKQRTDNEALSDPHWSVVEVLAWLTTRDIAMVFGVLDAVEYGNSKIEDGWKFADAFLRSDVAAHFCRCSNERCDCVDRAADAILRASEQGRLIATGNEVTSGHRRPIPATDYIDAEFGCLGGGSLSRSVEDKMVWAWTEVRFDAQRVRAIWPSSHVTPPKELKSASTGAGGHRDPAADLRNRGAEILAQQFDAEGVAKRSVKFYMIVARWSTGWGATAQVNMVTGRMTGGKKGRPSKGK